MPAKPKTFSATTTKSKPQYDRTRRSSTERGYSPSWSAYALWYRRQPENVVCACGCGQRSECVDHIEACDAKSELFWDMENHQALATKCHSRKTIRFDGAYGRKPDTSEAGRRALVAMKQAARERTAKIRARGA